jgi:hypothetical protein
VAVQLLGTCVALVSVVASGMQQIICGDLQKRHNVTSNQLLSLAAPYQVGASTGRRAGARPVVASRRLPPQPSCEGGHTHIRDDPGGGHYTCMLGSHC